MTFRSWGLVGATLLQIMQPEATFHSAYRALEARMKALAESDGDVFVPNTEPSGRVPYVLICMEPSLGRMGRSKEEATSKLDAGFRNFYASTEDFILHFCVRRYLCRPAQQYYITDFSKGAMLVDRAGIARRERYKRWYDLLTEEIDLVATPDAHIIAVGNVVSQHLEQQGFRRSVTSVMHYSGQAAAARNAAVVGREDSFRAFSQLVALEDVNATAEDVVKEARVPKDIADETLSRLARSELTVSRKKLMFSYKVVFESMLASRQA